VIYEFCTGRGAQFPLAFLGGRPPPYAEPAWQGSLVCEQYPGYAQVLDPLNHPGRRAAGCAAHYPERGFIWRRSGLGQASRGG